MFIEDGLVYRLPWGIEAIKVRAQANVDVIGDGLTIDDYETDLLVPAIENGTLNRSAALLMQAGFNSRKAAIRAVETTNAEFTNGRQLKAWLKSGEVFDLAIALDWPTPETSNLWWEFVSEFDPNSESTWKSSVATLPVLWRESYEPIHNEVVKLFNFDEGTTVVLASNGENIGKLHNRYKLLRKGIYLVKVHQDTNFVDVTYWGAGSEPFKLSQS
jgi:hypothetical protein